MLPSIVFDAHQLNTKSLFLLGYLLVHISIFKRISFWCHVLGLVL